MSNEFESLDKRVTALEKQQNNRTNLFSRSYSNIGDPNSDLLLKTKGQVKIQYGSKFIDLIKNGKINVDSKFIFEQDSIGIKDGIYVNGNQVNLKAGDNIINLAGQIGTTYVSFNGDQETTAEQKYQALTNIGLIYPSLDSVPDLQSGFIYIESEQKLYTIQDGSLTQYSIDIPNPYTQQFVIATNGSSDSSILIQGTGQNNSLAFSQMRLYANDYNGTIEANEELQIIVDNTTTIFTPDRITFNSPIKVNNISSLTSEFSLLVSRGQSTLTVDNIVVRNGIPYIPQIYNKEYLTYQNLISEILEYTDDKPSEETEEDKPLVLEITLKYPNQYKVGDIVSVYANLEHEVTTQETYTDETGQQITEDVTNIITELVELQFRVDESSDNSIIATLLTDTSIFEDFDYNSLLNQLIALTSGVFLCSDGLVIEENGEISLLVGIINDTTVGIQSKYGEFLEAKYSDNYQLDADDNSTKFASTEWVQNLVTKVYTDLDLTIYTDNVDPIQYFTNLEQLVNEQEDNTTQSYNCQYGYLTITKSGNNITYSAIVRSKLDNGFSYRSINAQNNNGTWQNVSTYILKEQFNPGYYYSTSADNNQPISPVYIGTDRQDFQVNSTNRYLWYTNNGTTWTLVDEYIDPVQDKIYIRTTTYSNRQYGDNTIVYYPAGFICYSKDGVSQTLGYGVSNFLKVYNAYVDPDPLTLLEGVVNNSSVGEIPQMEGFDCLWSLNGDPTDFNSWTLESNITNSTPVTKIIDECTFENVSGNRYGMTWVNVDDNGIITSLSDIVNDQGNPENWRNDTWVKYFLISVFASFLEKNKNRYTISWNFNYDGIVRLTSWAGQVTGYIWKPENPTSDDPNSIDYLPKSGLIWVSGTLFSLNYKVDFRFENIYFGKKLNLGECYVEQAIVGNTANLYNRYYDITWSGKKVIVTQLKDNTVIEM